MRVADIKCFCNGTDTGSFLKEGDYSGVLSSLDNLSPDLDTQIDTLKGEMSGGGLDASSLNLGGFSPLFEMGYTANNNIKSANNSINEIKEIIEADANTHMVNEWGKYHQEVQKCTEKKRSARDKAKSYYDGLSNDDPNRSSAQSAYLSAEAEYQEHVKELESSGTMLDTVSHKHYDILGYDASPAIQLTGVGTGYNSEGAVTGASVISGYSNLSSMNDSNNKKPQAVKEREFDTTKTGGASGKMSNEAMAVSAQIAQYAVNNCPGTTGWCAGSVENAINAVTGSATSGNAKDLLTNGALESAGYVRIDVDPASGDYQPVPGDVVVCNEGNMPWGGYSEYGHAQLYTEDGWYSDHKQNSMYIYSNENVVYRYQGN